MKDFLHHFAVIQKKLKLDKKKTHQYSQNYFFVYFFVFIS